MLRRFPSWAVLSVLLAPCAAAAQGRIPMPLDPPRRYDTDEMTRINMDPFLMHSGMPHSTDLQTPTGALFQIRSQGFRQSPARIPARL